MAPQVVPWTDINRRHLKPETLPTLSAPMRVHSCRCRLSQRRRKVRRHAGLHSCRKPCSERLACIICGPCTFMCRLQSLHASSHPLVFFLPKGNYCSQPCRWNHWPRSIVFAAFPMSLTFSMGKIRLGLLFHRAPVLANQNLRIEARAAQTHLFTFVFFGRVC